MDTIRGSDYATVERHQMNRVLRQFRFRQPISVEPKLACKPDYMPWFKIHGKPYLLLKDALAITRPNSSSDDTHTTTPSDYARCVSYPLYVS
ncbi:hypothetical protein Gotur_026686 [Gossypium turneri]